jgi:hypothetical protein
MSDLHGARVCHNILLDNGIHRQMRLIGNVLAVNGHIMIKIDE